METTIIENLKKIEKKNNVSILLAVESGSRAWGFPSEDSDYDVRFIYAHAKDWYLSVFEKRDVIEIPVGPVLDINGWDIKKSFQLLRKSNPSLQEWLTSPIIYGINKEALDPILSLSEKTFLPETSCHHYLSMAKGNMNKITKNDRIRIKAYLYSLRPILCCYWVIEEKTQPPMLFHELIDRFIPNGKLRLEINDLLKIKMGSKESDTIDRSTIIDEYLFNQFLSLENEIPKNDSKLSIEIFDSTFRETLEILASNNAIQWTAESGASLAPGNH